MNSLQPHMVSLAPGTGYGNAASQYLASLAAIGYAPSLGWIDEKPGSRSSRLSQLPSALRRSIDAALERPRAQGPLLLNLPPPAGYEDVLRTHAASSQRFAMIAWEPDRIPAARLRPLQRLDGICVPSRHNKRVLEEAGLAVPVYRVPHIAPVQELTTAVAPRMGTERFVFYTMGTWTSRKAMAETVRAYLDAFTARDPVTLVIKTEPINWIAWHALAHKSRGSIPPPAMTWWAVAEIVGEYREAAHIELKTERMSYAELVGIHRQGDCFVSLTRGEGWGLGIFEALLHDNPVIVTGWGGQLDYLGEGYKLLVPYELEAVGQTPADGYFDDVAQARWAKADRASCSAMMRAVFENPEPYRATARRLAGQARENYQAERVGLALAKHIGLTRTETDYATR